MTLCASCLVHYQYTYMYISVCFQVPFEFIGRRVAIDNARMMLDYHLDHLKVITYSHEHTHSHTLTLSLIYTLSLTQTHSHTLTHTHTHTHSQDVESILQSRREMDSHLQANSVGAAEDAPTFYPRPGEWPRPTGDGSPRAWGSRRGGRGGYRGGARGTRPRETQSG